MNEAGLNARWVGKDLTHRECQEFTKNVLNHMRERLSDYQELYGDLYNLEATPAESTTYRLAKHDKQRYPDIITAGAEGIRRITPTAPIFPWIIRRMYLTLWTSRMSFRLCTHREPCSTRSWARRCLTGSRGQPGAHGG